jgi:hypothetical protein
MKISIVFLMLAATCLAAYADDNEAAATGMVPARSIFSMDVGLVSDGHDGLGYVGFLRSTNFVDGSPIYYGFGSLFGGFVTTEETFFETGLLVGYHRNLGDTGLDIDAFLDLLITGGRIDNATLLYRAEAPAIHAGLSIGFFASSDVGCALTVAPVIRPYDLQTRSWNFSRSYVSISLALRLKSYALVEERPWSELITTATPGRNP